MDGRDGGCDTLRALVVDTVGRQTDSNAGCARRSPTKTNVTAAFRYPLHLLSVLACKSVEDHQRLMKEAQMRELGM